MAGVMLAINSGEVAIAAATAETVLQIVAAANHGVKVGGLGVFFKGTSPTDTPAKVEVVRQTDAGTMTAGSSGTNVSKKSDGDDETIQTTVRVNATAEPTTTDVLFTWEVHPQTGLQLFFPYGAELRVKGGGRLGVRITAAQGQTVVVTADAEE